MKKWLAALLTLMLAFVMCLSMTHAEGVAFTGIRVGLQSSDYALTIFWYTDGEQPEEAFLQDIQTVFFTAYPAMRETYGTTAGKEIGIYLWDASAMPENVPAYTSENNIHCSRQFLEDSRGNMNCIVHELFHVVQNGYPQAQNDALAAVLCEGLADVARYEYSVLEDPAWSLAKYAEGQSYMDSYTITAAFLVWAAETYDEDLCLRLNRILHEGGDASSAVSAITGYSIDDLWILYTQAAR